MRLSTSPEPLEQRSLHKEKNKWRDQVSIEVAKQIYEGELAATDFCGVI
jgi:hypothetical protein